jgi:hypothetical protein
VVPDDACNGDASQAIQDGHMGHARSLCVRGRHA